MNLTYERLGNYIREVDERNTDLSISNLIGVSMEKTFIPSVANTVGVDLSTYKILKKGQFACKLMSVGRDEKLPVDLYKSNEPAIVSSAYYVFESADERVLLQDYLLMWLCRSENDRYIGFISGGDVRGGISWDAFCDIPILVPHIEKQKEIVKEYNAIVNRIALNNQLIQKLEETAQAIYKRWFVDFEFPNEQGRSYKSNGGEMSFIDESQKEIPKDWNYIKLGRAATIKAGGDKPDIYSYARTHDCQIPIYSNSSANEGLFGFTNKATVMSKSITISARGAIIGYTELRLDPFVPIVRLIVVTPQNDYEVNYLFDTIRKFRYDNLSSAQGQLTVPDISSFNVIIPAANVLKKYQKIASAVFTYYSGKKNENKKLELMKTLLLSKLATIEN